MRRFNTELRHNIRWVFFVLPLQPFVLSETTYGSIKLFLFDCRGYSIHIKKTGGLYQIVVQTKYRINTGFFEVFLYQKWLKPKCNRNLFLMRGLHLIER